MDLLLTAFLYGLFSAVSFPAGALLGILLAPVRKDVGASFVAFGAGALLFAVTVEIYGHILADFDKGHTGSMIMWCTIAATFVGAAGYLYLNSWMEHALDAGDEKGAESDSEKSEGSEIWSPRPEEVDEDPIAALEAAQGGKGSQRKSRKSQMPDRTGSPGAGSETSAASSRRRTRVAAMERMQGVPVVGRKSIAKLNLHFDTESKFAKMEGRKARLSTMCTEAHVLMNSSTVQKTYSTIEEEGEHISSAEQEQKDTEEKEQKAAGLKLAMALFLGLLVDGIPEAALLGFLVAEGYLSYVLVLSIFLANFPEAFSSASLMTEAGIAKSVILGMWSGLCLLTGGLCTAACGLLVYFGGAGHGEKSLEMEISIATVEGLAAGSMICCISAVMLPEAYERRNQEHLLLSSGFLCAAGFLSAVALKVLERDLFGHGPAHFFFLF